MFIYGYIASDIILCSVVVRPLMVRWVVGSIPDSGSIELFLVSASVPQSCPFCLWDGAYKRSLAANQ